MTSSFLTALCVALPVVAAGLIHVAVIRAGLFPGLARIPLDGGVSVGGRPLFGVNKTLRGALAMIAATCASTLLLVALCGRGDALGRAMPPFESAHPAAWGFVCGLGYIAGELPNSFLKRRLGVGPGEAGAGFPGAVLWVVDQVDSMAGVWLFLLPVWPAPAAVLAWLVLITLAVHPMVAAVMVLLRLKTRVG